MNIAKQIQWLKQQPNEGDVKALSGGIEYIPIGIYEERLDELTDSNWSTTDFKFQIIKAGSYWLADGSCLLVIPGRTMQGAVTFPISSKDDNLDFSGTVLSFCIANACKKLGVRLGRGLNDRLDTGETAILISEKQKPKMDMIMLKKYEQAIKSNDTKSIEEIQNNYHVES